MLTANSKYFFLNQFTSNLFIFFLKLVVLFVWPFDSKLGVSLILFPVWKYYIISVRNGVEFSFCHGANCSWLNLRVSECVSLSSSPLTLKLRQVVWTPEPHAARQPAETTASSRRHFCSSRMGRSKLEAHAEQMRSNKVTLIVFISSTFPPQPPLILKTGRFSGP